MDLDVVVLAENVNERPSITTIVRMAFVAVDDSLRPRPVSRKVVARNSLEEMLQEEAYTKKRKNEHH